MAFDPAKGRAERAAFLQRYPLESLRELTLEQYSNLEREDSYTYWLEKKTEHAGSIWGGSSYKFGIYRRAETSEEDTRSAYLTDGVFAWTKKYGEDRASAWATVHGLVVQAAALARSGDYEAIDDIDLGHAYRWKLAFMYSQGGLLPIYNREMLDNVAAGLGISGWRQLKTSELQRAVFNRREPNEGVHEAAMRLLTTYGKQDTFRPPDTPLSTRSFNRMSQSLNQIFYGPPGTGKTYRTIEAAVQLINPQFEAVSRKAMVDEYKRLQRLGRIVFTTFHQSLSYEDFIEGIKPITSEEGQISYVVQPGIFKTLCTSAQQILEASSHVETQRGLQINTEFSDEVSFYKISLGDSTSDADDEIYDYCIENNCIALGYGGAIDFSEINSRSEISQAFTNADAQDSTSFVDYFKLRMQQGDIVLVSKGLHTLRAVGRITGEYRFDPDSKIRYNHFRNVEWLYVGAYPIKQLYGKQFSQRTLYSLTRKDIVIGLQSQQDHALEQTPNYVLIIDEINRGNVSKIFGELITLLEPDKRLGTVNELKVKLPYSPEEEDFGVPPNLYVIGTMNTADRSVVALDAALRRRFRFVEVGPDPSVLPAEAMTIDGRPYTLREIMETINARIECLRDRDHLVGHSYFLKMKTAADVAEQFSTGIIPLLREYFYEDLGQLEAILGSGFIAAETSGSKVSLPQGYRDDGALGLNEYTKYTVKSPEDKDLADALDILLNRPKPEA